MAHVTLNPVMDKVHGKIGELVFKRRGDDVVISRRPDFSKHEPTEGQVAHRERFKLATVYGKAVLADPQKKASYEAAGRKKGVPAFAMMIGDFLNAPAVDEIDLSAYTGHAGEPIRIRASDDFEVTGVEVGITDSRGTVLERGTAVASPNGAGWVYTTTTDLAPGTVVSIEVTATDRPGHKGTRTAQRS